LRFKNDSFPLLKELCSFYGSEICSYLISSPKEAPASSFDLLCYIFNVSSSELSWKHYGTYPSDISSLGTYSFSSSSFSIFCLDSYFSFSSANFFFNLYFSINDKPSNYLSLFYYAIFYYFNDSSSALSGY